MRVVGATNEDLPSQARRAASQGSLDRLACDVLTVPPLRARREDIPMLADHFVRAMAHDKDRRHTRFGAECPSAADPPLAGQRARA